MSLSAEESGVAGRKRRLPAPDMEGVPRVTGRLTPDWFSDDLLEMQQAVAASIPDRERVPS
jgi:hypothetical protein